MASDGSGAVECSGRVLSIQSHVVQGYVGNKSAVFPLQLLGMEVDIINSVHFSNHTGYPLFTGKHLRLTGDDLHDLLDGIEANGLMSNAYTHLLTGYIGSATLLDAIVRVRERLRAARDDPTQFMYVCDPVMGDQGKLYVPPELVELYRAKVVPIADVLTPNQYECELLTDRSLRTLADAQEACRLLHARGPRVVVISSFEETPTPSSSTAEAESKPREIVVIGSKVTTNDRTGGELQCEQYALRVPWIDSYYTGTGDLFAALLLARLHEYPTDFKRALECVVSTIQDVLRTTLELGGRNCELKLIESRFAILKGSIHVQATRLTTQ